MNKSTQTAETGEGNAPLLLTWPFGEYCIYCGKDSWTCEHFDPREEAERNQ